MCYIFSNLLNLKYWWWNKTCQSTEDILQLYYNCSLLKAFQHNVSIWWLRGVLGLNTFYFLKVFSLKCLYNLYKILKSLKQVKKLITMTKIKLQLLSIYLLFCSSGNRLIFRAGATGGREGASPPHSDYPAPSLKMSVKIDFIYEI